MELYQSLNDRIKELEEKYDILINKVMDISTNTEEKEASPYTIGSINKNPIHIADVGTNSDGSIAWNDSELNFPPKYTKPLDPRKGYNQHFHTRYAGGALDINALEIVEYDIFWANDTARSKHSQQFWKTPPEIKTTQNTKNETVKKIGTLALVFDADTVQWGTSAFELDVDKCFFVQKNPDGTIKLDSNGHEMKSKIFSTTLASNSLVWDKVNQCWKFYAVYAETPTP